MAEIARLGVRGMELRRLYINAVNEGGVMNKWYVSGRENFHHQKRLIADETTGKNIAVVYHPPNAQVIATAPTMLIVLQDIVAALSQNKTYPADIDAAKFWAIEAIREATQ